jgi:hypothetical protein
MAPPGLGGHFAREAQIARAREEAQRASESEEFDAAAPTAGQGTAASAQGAPPGAPAAPDAPVEAEDDAAIEGDEAEAPVPDSEELDAIEADEHEDEQQEHDDGAGYEGESDPDLAALPDPEEFHEGDAVLDEPETGDRPVAAPAAFSPPPPPITGSRQPPITARPQPLPPRPAPPPRPPQGPILPPYEQSRPGGGGSWETERISRTKAVLAVGATAVVVGAAAFAVLQLTGSDEQKAKAPASSSQADQDAPAKAKPAAAAIDPKKVTVSVLNGTTVGGLAADLGDKLTAQGFQLGNVTNNTDQQRAESVVLFAPGHEREAKEVGRRLKIAQREPIDPDSQTRAGDAGVVVVAGADLQR